MTHAHDLDDETLRRMMAGQTLSARPATALETDSRKAAEAAFGGFLGWANAGRRSLRWQQGYEDARTGCIRDFPDPDYQAGVKAGIAAEG